MTMDTPNQAIADRRIAQTAMQLRFPPTPDVAFAVGRRLREKEALGRDAGLRSAAPRLNPARLLAGAVILLVLLLAVAMAVPQVRAAVLEWLQIGAIRIFVSEEASVSRPSSPPTAPAAALDSEFPAPGSTSTEPTPPSDQSDLETLPNLTRYQMLAQAADSVDFGLLLPTFPDELGLPDDVYAQSLDGPFGKASAVILAWSDSERPGKDRFRLFQISAPAYGLKEAFRDRVRETEVNGNWAIWVQGPHRFQVGWLPGETWVTEAGHVLIWSDEFLTYRLETLGTLEEALKVAESLVPVGDQ